MIFTTWITVGRAAVSRMASALAALVDCLDAPSTVPLCHVLWHPVEVRASRYPLVRTPVVHRDVKPQNVIQRRAARAPGPRPVRARAWCRARVARSSS